MTITHSPSPFGRVLCAMITPFTAEGTLDRAGAQELAAHLVAEGCDGLVLNGTTGESPTTTDGEKAELITAVREAVGARIPLIAGVGGADAVLVVAPYYSRPPQEAVAAHFRAVADASGLPVLLYDIPGRTGTRIDPETILRLAGHPRIVGVKDCSYDLLGTQKVLSRAELAYYAGCDEHNLALYAIGAAGCISTVANAAPRHIRAVLDAFDAADTARARQLQLRATPLIESMMAAGLPGTVTAKALLSRLGLPAGPVRAPLLPASPRATAELHARFEELTES